jgi:MFS family permease
MLCATQVVVGILNMVSLFGLLLAGQIADWLGRKVAVATASVLFIAGAGMMCLAPSYPLLLAGRIVTGVGVGCGLLVPPVCTA